ncbi:MAG: two-component system response regulator [Chloroflexi bacterium HGW-Chloroflexi-4]|jgi:putative two-component system response regulator|nr:MAG: two-component system response regulator [Chloroflexi bacterium HGW-Chloroflexi-4]
MINSADILAGKILIVDDQPINILLLEQMLNNAGYSSISSTTDPREVGILHSLNRYDLILLDLQMPGMDGFEVMKKLNDIESDGYQPVLVITAQPNHKLHALQVGAKDFISKPFELSEVLARVHNLMEVRLLHKKLKEYNSTLEIKVQERTAELQESNLESLFTLTRAVEYKDKDIGTHIQRISKCTSEFGKLLNQSDDFNEMIYVASPLHDVGKIGIPDHILLKSGPLSPDEWKIMKEHTTIGASILGNSNSPMLKMGAEIALNHHECWDGSGYPNGLQSNNIPLSARIMNICDIYDALRSKRPYKPACSHLHVFDIITNGDGRTLPEHFDPAILQIFKQHHKAFREIYDDYGVLA